MNLPDIDKRKHIGKIMLTYAGAGWVIIQVVNLIISQYEWSVAFLDITILLFLFGLPAALMYALYGTVISKKTKLIYTINIFLALSTIGYYFLRPDSLHPNQIKFMKFKGDQKKIAQNIQSIAILPFANHTGDSLSDYLPAAIHDALNNEIGAISSLRVISLTTVKAISKQNKTLQQIAEELNVDAIIEGSILLANGSIRVNVSLMNAFPQEMQLWSKDYNESLTSLVNVYSKITKNLAEEIELPLTIEEQSKLNRSEKVDPAAYEAYLKGKSSMGLLTEDGIKASIGYFERAIELDPNYAPAYAALGGVWGFLKQMNIVTTDQAALHFTPNLEKANALDPNLAEVHVWNATKLIWTDFNWDDGEASFLKAIELNPNTSETRGGYSSFLLSQNRIAEARIQMDIALELDPENLFMQSLNLGNLGIEGNYKTCIELGEELQKSNNNPAIIFSLLQSYAQINDYDNQIKQAIKWLEISNYQDVIPIMEKTYKEEGLKMAFLKTCEALEEKDPSELIAEIMFNFYAMGGNRDKTLDWIEKSYIRKDPQIPFLNIVPSLKPYRNDPRFKEIINRLKLPSPTTD